MPVDKPSSEEKEFWETVLHDHRLGMSRGKRAWISYGHEEKDRDAAKPSDNYSEESKP